MQKLCRLPAALLASDNFSRSWGCPRLDLGLPVRQNSCVDSFPARQASPRDRLLTAHRVRRFGMVREHHHALAARTGHGYSLPREYVVSHIGLSVFFRPLRSLAGEGVLSLPIQRSRDQNFAEFVPVLKS